MSRKLKVPAEEKIKLVEKYLRGEISLNEAAGIAGVLHSTVEGWVTEYKGEGITAFMPQKRNKVYSPELKKQAVEEYLKGEGSQDFICQKYKIRSRSQLRNWIKVYNAHGSFNKVKFSGGGSYMKQGRQDTTQEERIEIAKYCIRSGHNYGEAAKKYNVSYQQARNWTLKYEEQGEAGLEDRRGQRKRNQTPRTEEEALRIRIEQLEREKYELEAENDFLKKLQELERGDPSQK